jgi:hypothetical protein
MIRTKLILPTLAALGISCLLVAPARAGLVGLWTFDDQTLNETSGFQPPGTHDGLPIGNVGYTTGVRGTPGALDLRNSFGAVKVKNSHNNNPGGTGPEGNYQDTFNERLYSSPAGFTIAFWAKNRPKDDWSPWIARKGEADWGYQVRRRGGANYPTFTIRSSTGDDDPDGATTDFSDGRWHHVTAVYDPVNGKRLLYVDGVAELDIADGGIGNNSGEYLTFGARHNDYGNPNNFENFSRVALDEIRIYDHALPVGDVQALVGDPWIYVDSQPAAMQVGMPELPVTVTVPASLVATSTVTVVVTSSAPGVVTPVGGVAGSLTLTFAQGDANVQLYSLQAVGPGSATVQHTSPNAWVDGTKQVGVWPATPPADGLVAYWSFDSDNLTESGGAVPAGLHDGEPQGSVAYTEGRFGQGRALDLTATNTAVRIRNSGGNDPVYVNTFDGQLYNSFEGFSIALWVKGLPANEWCPWIAKKGEDSWGYQIRKVGGGPGVTFTLRSSDGDDDPSGTTTDFNDGRWHHLVAVYDPVNFQRRLYVDGVPQISIYDFGLNPANTAAEHLMLGARQNETGDPIQNISYGGNISLDEVRIYQKALDNVAVMDLLGAVAASPGTLSLVTPSANDQFITLLVPPSAVAAGPVTVTITSDAPGVAIPEGAVNGVLSVTLPQGGLNSTMFAVQANGAGTAHFTYQCATLPVSAYTTIAVQQPNINGLVAYWNFNNQTLAETSGFQAAGLHDGEAVGDVRYVPGLNGGHALDLRQANTAVRVKNSVLTDANYRTTFDAFLFGSPAGFTWTCWVRGLPVNDWQPYIAKDGESFGYAVRKAGGNDLTFTLRNSSADPDDPTSATARINDSLWHHLAAVYDPANFARRLYLDGVEVISVFDSTLVSPPINSPLFFGARAASGDTRFARVIMDEIRAYDTNLPPEVILAQVGTPMISLVPGALSFNAGDPAQAVTITVPADLVAAGQVQVTLTSASLAVAVPEGAVNGSLTVTFPQGGANTASVGIQALATGTALITATSPGRVVNGDTTVTITPTPRLIGRWFPGAASLADWSGFTPPGTHNGVAIGGNAGALAYSTEVPPGFSGQSLDLTAGNVGVMIANSANTDPGYLPTFDTTIATNFSVAFWAKGMPGEWAPWVAKRGESGIGWQLRRMGNDPISGLTIRGVDNEDGWGSGINVNDGNWHHYVGIWDQPNGRRLLYVDGVFSHAVYNNPAQTAALAPAKSLAIGARAAGDAGFEGYFAGLIYDVRIYDNGLSPARIAALQLPEPALTIQPWTGNQVRISWPIGATGYALEKTGALPGGWGDAGLTVTTEGNESVAYAPAATGTQFFRLKK